MDYLNKIKNTLTSTVNEIAHALPGNPLLREYDTGDQVASAGPDYIWKIYDGTKKSTKAPVSIFVLAKRQLEQYPRSGREQILESARKGVVQLTKLRHPRILTVEHAVEESRDSLVFCTEPVFASLGNVLGTKKNIDDLPTPLRSYNLYDVEIKYGVLQITEGLSFLHGSANMLHGNLCPESIVINKQGVWKLSGFDFCVSNNSQGGEAKFTCRDWSTSLPPPAQPNPCYLAPEMVLEKRCDFSSDLFSLGALLYTIYYKGNAMLECDEADVYRVMSKKVDDLRHLSNYDLSKFPKEVIEHEKMLLHPDSRVRPDADQMSKLPYFEDIGVVTLQYLDNILHRDNLEKSQFFKELSKVMSQLPKRVVMQRILPSLCAEFNNNNMLPFVLPHVMTVAEDCNDAEYAASVFPHLIPVFKVQSPVQVLLILLQNMELLLKKTPKAQVQAHILPMICNALSAPSLRIQELCLSIVPNFATLLDTPSMNNSIMPKIKKIVWEGGTASVRINGLVCIGKLLPMLDKWFVYDEVFKILFQIKSREPGIMMAILGIFQTTFNHKKLGISKDVLATKVIPYLVPFTVEMNLNAQQFATFMKVIKEMLQRVESDQRSKLEQVSHAKVDDSTRNFKKLTANVGTPVTQSSDVFDIGNTTAPAAEPLATRQHLTLEEKQKLARANEAEYRMKQQGELKPKQLHSAGGAKKGQPKDLTSTLMQNNLSAMSPGSNIMASRPMNNSSFSPNNSFVKPSNASNRSISSYASNPQSQFSTMSISNGIGFNGATQTGYAGQSWNTGFPRQQNSSLDSLMSMPSHSKPSMNAMQSNPGAQRFGMQPTIQRPPGTNPASAFNNANPFTQPTPMTAQNQGKPTGNLSQQDLLDFLG